MTLTGVAEAQEQGTLQVAAQVVSATPSQVALASGLTAVTLRTEPATQTLASIKVSTEPSTELRDRAARRRRTVLVISFLRN